MNIWDILTNRKDTIMFLQCHRILPVVQKVRAVMTRMTQSHDTYQRESLKYWSRKLRKCGSGLGKRKLYKK